MSGVAIVTKSVFDQGSSCRTMFLTTDDSPIYNAGQSLHVGVRYATTSGAGGEWWIRRRRSVKLRVVLQKLAVSSPAYDTSFPYRYVVSVGSWEGISWITKRFVRRIRWTLKKWISSQRWRWSTTADLFLKREMVQLESYNKHSVMFWSIPPRHSYIKLYTTQHTRASTCTEAWECGQRLIDLAYYN